jgi:hypothetical protein
MDRYQSICHALPSQSRAATLLDHQPKFVDEVRVSLQYVEQVRFLGRRRIIQKRCHITVLSRPVHWK